jgi:alkylation response protein AidB-like acyl-CoA dehydrogenase
MEADVAKSLLKKLVPFGYLGGADDLITTLILLEELAVVFPSLAGIATINEACIKLLKDFVHPDVKERLLDRTMKGDLIGCVGISEPGTGSDPSAMETRAVRDGDNWMINGTKTWISNGHISDYCIVYSQTDTVKDRTTIQPILVERLRNQYQSRDIRTIGLRGFPCSELYFQDCKVPRKNTVVTWAQELGEKDKDSEAKTLNMWNMLIYDVLRFPLMAGAAIATGVARRAFDMALEYVKVRKQFGREIGRFQLIQEMIVDMATEIDCARLLTYRAGHRCMQSPSDMEASMAKAYATEMSVMVTSKAIQCMGAMGLTEEARVERCFRDARMMTMPDGTTQIQKLKIGRQLIGMGGLQ